MPPVAARRYRGGVAWFTYVLRSGSARRTYVGVTTDVARRARQHNGELAGGARSTRAGRPWTVAAVHGPFPTRGRAQQLEHALRRRRGVRRLDLG
jgi:predicted GIY-YIG superfamily endonuclease